MTASAKKLHDQAVQKATAAYYEAVRQARKSHDKAVQEAAGKYYDATAEAWRTYKERTKK